jgi:hypothetical protein
VGLENVGEFSDGVQLFLAKCRKRGSGSRIGKGVNESTSCLGGGIGRRCFWYGAVTGKKFDGFGDAFRSGF